MLYHSDDGILAAPLMVDINLDNVHDIIFCASNRVFALDGLNYQPIWNVSLYDYAPRTLQITITR